MAGELQIAVAVLKEGSPSCGSGFVYDGSFTGSRVLGGMGETARVLREYGVRVFNETQRQQADAALLGSTPIRS